MHAMRTLALWGGLALLASGCAAHVKGLVRPLADGGTLLETTEGDAYHLNLAGDAKQLGYLDGHLVEVWGKGSRSKLNVEGYHILRGVTGMTVFTGPLVMRSGELTIQDRYAQGFILLDDSSLADLLPYLGKPVLVEGYVEGAQRVKVVKWRVLADTPSGG
jgi:hypothetical protein